MQTDLQSCHTTSKATVSVSWFKDSTGAHAEGEKIKSFQSISTVRRYGKVICSHWGVTTSLSKTYRPLNTKWIPLKSTIPCIFLVWARFCHWWDRYSPSSWAIYSANCEQKISKKLIDKVTKSEKTWLLISRNCSASPKQRSISVQHHFGFACGMTYFTPVIPWIMKHLL